MARRSGSLSDLPWHGGSVAGPRDGEDGPLARDSPQVADPAVIEPKTSSGRQVAHRARDQDLARARGSHDPRPDVDRDAAHLGPALLHLTDVQPGAHLDAQLPDPGNHVERALDGGGRRIEDGEEAVARRVHLPAAAPPQRRTDQRVVELDEIAPAAVTEFSGVLRRADDVGEEDCRQESFGAASAFHAPSLTPRTTTGNAWPSIW